MSECQAAGITDSGTMDTGVSAGLVPDPPDLAVVPSGINAAAASASRFFPSDESDNPSFGVAVLIAWRYHIASLSRRAIHKIFSIANI